MHVEHRSAARRAQMVALTSRLGAEQIAVEGMFPEQIWAQLVPLVTERLSAVAKLVKAQTPTPIATTPTPAQRSASKPPLKEEQKVSFAADEPLPANKESSAEPKEQRKVAHASAASKQKDYELFMAEVEGNEEEFNRKYVGDEDDWEGDEDGEEPEEDAQQENDEEADEAVEEDTEGDGAEEVFNDMRFGVNERNLARLEKKLIEPREWQMRGEIRASQRPADGLLTADLEFDRGLEPNLRLSSAASAKIEDIIRLRIKDKLFDDRQMILFDQKAINEQSKFAEVSTEKDRRGLGEIFEEKYRSQVLGVDDKAATYKREELEMRELFRKICYSIDQMSRLNYTPVSQAAIRPVSGEDPLVIEESVGAIVTEDLLKSKKDYKEIFRPKRKELVDRNEMNTQEKKSLRRRMKRIHKIQSKKSQFLNRVKSGLTVGETKLLQKNMGKLQSQISHSKVKPTEFTGLKDSFKILEQRKKISKK